MCYISISYFALKSYPLLVPLKNVHANSIENFAYKIRVLEMLRDYCLLISKNPA